MTNSYEYMNESSVDVSLKCTICTDPFTNPCSTPCEHTFCRLCITNWIGENDRCPVCGKKPLTIGGLKATNRIVFDLLDRLPVRCGACRQTNIQRGNFDEHINKICSRSFVACSAADLKCPWQGPRDERQAHTNTCQYESMRPFFENVMGDMRMLNGKVQQCDNQIKNQENLIITLQIENRQLREQVHELQKICSGQVVQIRNLSIAQTGCESTCDELKQKMQWVEILSKILPCFQAKWKTDDLFFSSHQLQTMNDYKMQIVILDPSAGHNPRLEEILARCHLYSTVKFNDLRLNHFDIPFIIRKALILKQCSVLDLSNNMIESIGIELLANTLHSNVTLKRLSLKGNHTGYRGVQSLTQALLTNVTLEVLELETNDIPDEAAESLAKMLRRNSTLKELYLGYNAITSDGMILMANALDERAALIILSLCENGLDDKCVDTLEKMLNVNQKLQRLDIHSNRFSMESKIRLLHIVKAKKNFKLNV